MTPKAGPIVPRWEWRTFGEEFGDAEARFSELTPEGVQERDDLYLLSPRSDASVKVREGLMDVKELVQVNEDGLEQWKPVMKTSFPLSAVQVREVLNALGLPHGDLSRSEYSLEVLRADVVNTTDELQAVAVHKRREHYTVGGCMAELSDVRTESGSTRTIAMESEDPARVSATVRDFGLASRPNISFPKGLKGLVGFGGRRLAVIDIGTNSVKFHVAERLADGSWRTIVDRAEVTRLGEGLDQADTLQPEPFERTLAAVEAMVAEARQDGAEAIAAVGTAGLRRASNSSEFVRTVRDRTGVEIEVIPGEEEARLAYLAVRAAIDVGKGSLVVFDTGGGSSEFTFGHGDAVDERFSVDVGAARFTERFRLAEAVDRETVAAARGAIASDLARLDGRPAPDALVGLGGAITNLAAVKAGLATYDPDVVQGTELDTAEIDRQIELYRSRTAEERREIVGLQPKRAEVILAGACIVRTVLQLLGKESLTVSDRGVRHGLLLECFGS